MSTINSTSKRTGIEVTRYDFSDPQAGKDLCDRKIAPCKQRLRNYVSENNDIETAEDVKNALESPPGIAGTRVAVCKIDASKMSAAVGNNKIPGITRYNNFSFEADGMRVWQAYGVGEGMKIKELESKQDVSGLERVGEWSHEAMRVQPKKSKAKSKNCEGDPTSTYSCLEPACILTFTSLEDADQHMDTERHVMLPANECVYDTIRRQWASTTTSIKGKSQRFGVSQYHTDVTVEEGARKGWALKKQKATVRISPAVKEYLTRVFNEGTKDGHPKANPTDVAEDVKRKVTRPEWLEAQTIKGYFSRLAALQRGQEINEQDANRQDVAIAREEFLQNLIDEVQEQVDLQHPLIY